MSNTKASKTCRRLIYKNKSEKGLILGIPLAGMVRIKKEVQMNVQGIYFSTSSYIILYSLKYQKRYISPL